MELQWNPWPDGHKGPILTYLANCHGPCETVDPDKLEFFKIQERGLLAQPGEYKNGYWATDELIAANTTWTLQLPPDIAPGNYVMRHELITLFDAFLTNGARNYPQCINLQIEGSGSAKPQGVLATELYKADDPGLLYNIWAPTLAPYKLPGPPLYTGKAAELTSATTHTMPASLSIVKLPVAATRTVRGPACFPRGKPAPANCIQTADENAGYCLCSSPIGSPTAGPTAAATLSSSLR